VLLAQGSSARLTGTTKDKPVDAVIMAIVDRLDVEIPLEAWETAAP
jgi:ethanolamine utilization protein EutN